jgi:hypothetical protein
MSIVHSWFITSCNLTYKYLKAVVFCNEAGDIYNS